GRKDQFSNNRKLGGISGFPKRSESVYDAFGTGHSSTSISAVLGMAVADKLKGETNKQHVAVIGDGALTGGMAFEGLNHAGSLDTNILVILNDNSISIDPSMGALKNYLNSLARNEANSAFREGVTEAIRHARDQGVAESVLKKMESTAYQLMGKEGNFFESLNFSYYGPVDGHDVEGLVAELERLKAIPGPKLLHVLTLKGKGFKPAEKEQTLWHAPGTFDKLSGEIIKKKKSEKEAPKFQDVFGHTLLELAKNDDRIVGITPAMPTGCSMNIMMDELPERVFDVGIAEQHAVTFSAGLAAEGLIPFCNLYSTFAQRAYDQIIHDVCVQSLPVRFCLDRAGLVGSDGPTHHGAFDIAFLRSLPNMVVAAPLNEHDLRNLMFTAAQYTKGPISIRYPRGNGYLPEWKNEMELHEIGKATIRQDGENIAILSFGAIGIEAIKAAAILQKRGIHPSIADMRFVKPMDEALISQLAKTHQTLITLEDGSLEAGFGSAVLETLNQMGLKNKVIRLGIPDRFIEQGSQQELYKLCGMDADSIVSLIENLSA
ncbi:MAG: 1-deoxy-D-xylulose-5-phosphate synthase, partial [Bacteroidota bacterium]|nr:1-deoxy-D-xylulose-5-phosphate synthase [Bacteroidota bacterium]MDX5431764.1 1-deoxy-D-xylulose-5-phosphate synthase [Bacteroidota bacterium]MDX5470477.1 1-deoxy-D-xylulose-5-phosphate synthase [Bacteroidota bacterium]